LLTCIAPDGTTQWQQPGAPTPALALTPTGDLYLALSSGLKALRR
jgi:hypothetical protein